MPRIQQNYRFRQILDDDNDDTDDSHFSSSFEVMPLGSGERYERSLGQKRSIFIARAMSCHNAARGGDTVRRSDWHALL